jgi:hypothetical protein
MKTAFLTLIFALAISTLSLPSVLAQTLADTPETVAKAYMEATRAGDTAKCASLMHPDALRQLRGLFGPLVSATKTEKSKQEMEAIFGVKDKDEFDKLSDEELGAKFFNMLYAISPELKKALNASSFEIVGQVQQDPGLVHIVYRMYLKIEAPNLKDPIPFTKLDVMSLRRFENSWRAELKGDLQGMIQAMAAGMASAAEEKEKANSAAEEKEKAKSAAPAGRKITGRKP